MGGLRQAAFGQIGPGIGCGRGFELQAEPFDRLFHNGNQLGATVCDLCGTGIAFWHGHARFARKDLDRLHETKVFGFLDEGQRIAFGVAAKAIVIAFAVIHMKRRGFFLMKRARRPHVAFALVGFAHVPCDLAPDNGRQGNAGAQFVKETGWQ